MKQCNMSARRLIVNGLAITVDQAPYVVRLYGPNPYIGFCGGSLLSDRAVLTAAHCLVDDSGSVAAASSLFVGTYHSDILAEPTELDPLADIVPVVAVDVHPDYQSGDPNAVVYGQDVAVLTLSRTPAHFGDAVGPRAVSLDDGTFWPDSANRTNASYVVGYGSESYDGPQSYYLQAAHVHLLSRTRCAQMLGFSLASSNGCAGLDGADACSGDSGGPLVVAHRGNFVQTAIVSWGVGSSDCGDPENPGIYSLVASARAFIESRVSAAQFETWPFITEDDPCACADDCVSNGFDVSPRCGCADHLGNGQTFCYVKSDACYPLAIHSTFVFGALFRTCVLPPPPLLPPPSPRAPPPPLLPPPPPRAPPPLLPPPSPRAPPPLLPPPPPRAPPPMLPHPSPRDPPPPVLPPPPGGPPPVLSPPPPQTPPPPRTPPAPLSLPPLPLMPSPAPPLPSQPPQLANSTSPPLPPSHLGSGVLVAGISLIAAGLVVAVCWAAGVAR